MQYISEALTRAKKILNDGGYTSAALCGDDIYVSCERGVKPLIELYDRCSSLEGASCADKVVGKAAAMIYAKLGIRELYAGVISRPALDVLEEHGIAVSYGELTDAIRNRAGDGFCPMESAVMDISDVDAAIKAIRDKISFLNNIKTSE